MWGQGLATEGARGALEYGFGRLGLDRIIAIYDIRKRGVGAGHEEARHAALPPHADPNHEVDLEVYELRREGWARDG